MRAQEILIALSCLAMLLLLCSRRSVEALKEGIRNFTDHFRGGPPAPMHPSPANDSALLNHRSRKVKSRL